MEERYLRQVKRVLCLPGKRKEEVLRDLCGRSYALAVEKLPKYAQRELAAPPAEN